MSDRNSERVAVQDTVNAVYLAVLPRGPITVLTGTAATIWREATTGAREGTADRVAAAVGLDPEQIRESVDDFVDRLVGQGLIISSQ
ncbi:PqqD family protein [Microbacterium sp. P5_E9]